MLLFIKSINSVIIILQKFNIDKENNIFGGFASNVILYTYYYLEIFEILIKYKLLI